MKHFISNCKNITSDSDILDIVTGMHIEFYDIPTKHQKVPFSHTIHEKSKNMGQE